MLLELIDDTLLSGPRNLRTSPRHYSRLQTTILGKRKAKLLLRSSKAHQGFGTDLDFCLDCALFRHHH